MNNFHLTARETEVLSRLARGLKPRSIGTDLGLSVHTVRGHVKSVLRKLGTHTQLQAVLEAERRGLLPQR